MDDFPEHGGNTDAAPLKTVYDKLEVHRLLSGPTGRVEDWISHSLGRITFLSLFSVRPAAVHGFVPEALALLAALHI